MTRKTYGAEEARANLPELLDRARRGETTVITKHGKPCAALVPVEEAVGRRLPLLSLKGTGAGLWGKDSKRAIADLRGEWE